MLSLLGLVLIPLVLGGLGALIFKNRITVKEFLLLEAIALVLCVGGWGIARYGAMQDTEHWNGRVSAKTHGSQKCCHCRMVCDRYEEYCSSHRKDGSCSSHSRRCVSEHEVCDHFRDYWWSLELDMGDTLEVDRCEPHENDVPAIWTRAYVGEPATKEHSYTNYLRADPDSLMHRSIVKPEYVARIPNGIPPVTGMYHSAKVITEGCSLPAGWDEQMRELNADISGPFQVDVMLYVTNVQDPSYADSVEAKWLYGPKNALTIVAGTDGTKFTWVRVVTLSRVEELKVLMRDKLTGMSVDDPTGGIKVIRQVVTGKFKRTPMKEWEYLASAASPSDGWLTFLYILMTVLTLVGLYVMHENDIFGEEGGSWGGLRRSRNPWNRDPWA